MWGNDAQPSPDIFKLRKFAGKEGGPCPRSSLSVTQRQTKALNSDNSTLAIRLFAIKGIA